jgi:hypothetical protein
VEGETNRTDLPNPEGSSVYDRILPASVAWKRPVAPSIHNNEHAKESAIMPLIQHLKDGYDTNKPSAWHRNEERRARGLFPVNVEDEDNHDLSDTPLLLEGWERELLWTEILLLTGNPDASFPHLARAWGREKGFHKLLAQFICEGRGDVKQFSPSREKITTLQLDPQVNAIGIGNIMVHSEQTAASTTASKRGRMMQDTNSEEFNQWDDTLHRRDMCDKIDDTHDSITAPTKSADDLEISYSREK